MDPLGNTATILNSVVSNSYYAGVLRWQISVYLALKRPITSISNKRIKIGRRITVSRYHQVMFHIEQECLVYQALKHESQPSVLVLDTT